MRQSSVTSATSANSPFSATDSFSLVLFLVLDVRSDQSHFSARGNLSFFQLICKDLQNPFICLIFCRGLHLKMHLANWIQVWAVLGLGFELQGVPTDLATDQDAQRELTPAYQLFPPDSANTHPLWKGPASVLDMDFEKCFNFLFDSIGAMGPIPLFNYLSSPYVVDRLDPLLLARKIQELIILNTADALAALSKSQALRRRLRELEHSHSLRIPLPLMEYCLDNPQSDTVSHIATLYSSPDSIKVDSVDESLRYLLFGAPIQVFDVL
jgi:hypothetical protein